MLLPLPQPYVPRLMSRRAASSVVRYAAIGSGRQGTTAGLSKAGNARWISPPVFTVPSGPQASATSPSDGFILVLSARSSSYRANSRNSRLGYSWHMRYLSRLRHTRFCRPTGPGGDSLLSWAKIMLCQAERNSLSPAYSNLSCPLAGRSNGHGRRFQPLHAISSN